MLKPGALYAECAVIPVNIPASSIPRATGRSEEDKGKKRSDGDSQPDDGELGGVALGMQVWDDYERELKAWDAEVAQTDKPEK